MHSEWASPIVPILKPDKKVRLCGDFKVTINPVLDVDRLPVTLPKLEELLATVSGGKWFSKLDPNCMKVRVVSIAKHVFV